MLFDFSLKSSILLIFFVHGIVFSVLVLNKGIQNQNKASFWLSAFLFLCAMYITPFMLGYAGWYSGGIYREIMFFVPFQQLFLIGPVIFFYAQSLLNKSFNFSKNDLVHFIPSFFYLIYSVIVFITDKLILNEYYFYADGRDKDLAPWYQFAGLISMFFYLALSLRIYSIYKKLTYEEVSFAETISFSWMQRFLVVFLIILMLRILFFLVNPEWNNFGSKFWYYFCFSILFYYIAISGYSNSVKATIAFRTNLFSKESDYFVKENEATGKEEIFEIEDWKQKVEKLIKTEKEYQNPELTLTNLAQKLAVTPKKLSGIINQGFKLNFNDFVNFYRTEAVIEKFALGEHNLQNLLKIAFDCGFNSKSTFNRAFKKHTSLTPKEFLKKNYKN